MVKDVSEVTKKVSEQGMARLIDHVLANNMRLVAELATIKGAIKKHESIFKSYQG